VLQVALCAPINPIAPALSDLPLNFSVNALLCRCPFVNLLCSFHGLPYSETVRRTGVPSTALTGLMAWPRFVHSSSRTVVSRAPCAHWVCQRCRPRVARQCTIRRSNCALSQLIFRPHARKDCRCLEAAMPGAVLWCTRALGLRDADDRHYGNIGWIYSKGRVHVSSSILPCLGLVPSH